MDENAKINEVYHHIRNSGLKGLTHEEIAKNC